jgi:hypothetical protein
VFWIVTCDGHDAAHVKGGAASWAKADGTTTLVAPKNSPAKMVANAAAITIIAFVFITFFIKQTSIKSTPTKVFSCSICATMLHRTNNPVKGTNNERTTCALGYNYGPKCGKSHDVRQVCKTSRFIPLKQQGHIIVPYVPFS